MSWTLIVLLKTSCQKNLMRKKLSKSEKKYSAFESNCSHKKYNLHLTFCDIYTNQSYSQIWQIIGKILGEFVHIINSSILLKRNVWSYRNLRSILSINKYLVYLSKITLKILFIWIMKNISHLIPVSLNLVYDLKLIISTHYWSLFTSASYNNALITFENKMVLHDQIFHLWYFL